MLHVLIVILYKEMKKRARDAAENSRAESTIILLLTIITIYICMVTHIARIRINRVRKVAIPARGQLNRENTYFPVRVVRA